MPGEPVFLEAGRGRAAATELTLELFTGRVRHKPSSNRQAPLMHKPLQ